jgi:hypothetical protein
MPFEMIGSGQMPYILEAMEIYAQEVVKNNAVLPHVINLVCPKCGNTGRYEPRTLIDPDEQECDCGQTCL